MFLKYILIACIVFSFVISGVPIQCLAQDDGPTYREVIHIDPESRPDLNHIGWVEWSPDGTQLAFIDFLDIHILDISTYEISQTIKDAHVDYISWNPSGDKIAGGSGEQLSVWDTKEGVLQSSLVQPYPEPRGILTIYQLAWSPDGKWIASDNNGIDALIWEPVSNEVIELKSHNRGGVGEISWSPDSTRIVTVGVDYTIRLWDVESHQSTILSKGDGLVDWHPSAEVIAWTGINDEIIIWDMAAEKEVLRIKNETSLSAMEWNYDGSMLATGNFDGDVQIWNSDTGEQVMTFKAHKSSIMALSWHPTQNLLVSTGYDGELWVWEIIT